MYFNKKIWKLITPYIGITIIIVLIYLSTTYIKEGFKDSYSDQDPSYNILCLRGDTHLQIPHNRRA